MRTAWQRDQEIRRLADWMVRHRGIKRDVAIAQLCKMSPEEKRNVFTARLRERCPKTFAKVQEVAVSAPKHTLDPFAQPRKR